MRSPAFFFRGPEPVKKQSKDMPVCCQRKKKYKEFHHLDKWILSLRFYRMIIFVYMQWIVLEKLDFIFFNQIEAGTRVAGLESGIPAWPLLQLKTEWGKQGGYRDVKFGSDCPPDPLLCNNSTTKQAYVLRAVIFPARGVQCESLCWACSNMVSTGG